MSPRGCDPDNPVATDGQAGEAPPGAGEAAARTIRVPRCAVSLLLGWGAIGGLFWAARSAGSWSPWSLLAFVVGLSVPIFMFGAWSAALRRAHELRLFREGGRMRSLLGGPFLRTVAGLLIAFVLALAVFIGAAGEHPPTWMALLVPPLLCLGFVLAERVLRAEMALPQRRAMALRAAVLLAPLLLVVADFLIASFGFETPRHASLADAVRANLPPEPAHSQLVDELLRLAAYMNAMQAFALGMVADWGGAFRLAAGVGTAALNFAFYAGLARAVAMFFLPWAELRRAFLPAGEAPVPRRLSVTEIATASALATIIPLFILVPAFGKAEGWLKHNRPSILVGVAVEKIDGRLVRPGTIEILDKLRADTVKGLGVDRAALAQAANAGFDAMEANVDAYLDAYYSLPAEYLRIASLIGGASALEEKMAADFKEYLMAGDPFAGYDAQVDAALAAADRVRSIYGDAVERVLDRAALDLPPDARVKVVASASLGDLALPTPELALTTSGDRMVSGAVAGGLIAALVVKKVVAKGTLKLAAMAVAKVAVSKGAGASGGAGAGALAGAAIGSVVPGVGTAAGAVVGGVVGGIAVGVGVDYLMLKLDEAWSRDDFRQQILDALEAQRAEFLAQLAPQP